MNFFLMFSISSKRLTHSNLWSGSLRPLLFSVLCLFFVFELSGCAKSFKVKAIPTENFPIPWDQPKRGSLKPSTPRIKTATPKQVTQPPPIPSLSSSQLPKSLSSNKGGLERVAVLELRNRISKQVSVDEIGFLANEMRTVASYLPKSHFLIMTRESMASLIDPSKNLEECIGVCEIETGRLLGAQWIITGDVVRFGSSLRVSLKLHNTKTGQFIKGGSVKGKKVEDLEEVIKIETMRLIVEMSPYLKQRLIELGGKDPKEQIKFLLSGEAR